VGWCGGGGGGGEGGEECFVPEGPEYVIKNPISRGQKMCDYKTRYLDYKERVLKEYRCPHRPVKELEEDGKKLCIFHGKKEDKDVEKFYKGFRKLYKEENHNFAGFVFPKGFDFGKLKEETGPLKFVDSVFTRAHFLCDVYLLKAQFSGEGGTDFRGAQFSGEGEVLFYGKTFHNKNEADFSRITIGDKAKITFDGVDLNRARFLITDLRRINFIEVDWTAKKPDSSSYMGRLKVYDETFQERGVVTRNVYRLWYLFKLWLFILKWEAEEKEEGSRWRIVQRKIAVKIIDRWKINEPEEKKRNHYEVYRLYNQLMKNYTDTNRYH